MGIRLEADCIKLLTACLFVPVCCFGSEIVDNFNSGALGWTPTPSGNWTVIQSSPGVFAYRGDFQGTETIAYNKSLLLDTSWAIEVDAKVQKVYGGQAFCSSGVDLFPADAGVQVLAHISQKPDGNLWISLGRLDTTNWVWQYVFKTDYISGPRVSSQYHLKLTRFSGYDSVGFTVTDAHGFSFHTNSPSFPVGFLDKMKHAAFPVDNGQVDYSNFCVVTPVAGFDGSRSLWSLVHGFRLKLIPPTDTPVQVEASNDLINWTPVTVFPNLATPLEFFDPSAVNFQSQFYRVVQP